MKSIQELHPSIVREDNIWFFKQNKPSLERVGEDSGDQLISYKL